MAPTAIEPKAKPVHKLKTWPEFFDPAYQGLKNFEVRYADREFRAGDFIELQEWDPETREYTGRTRLGRITYVMDDARFVRVGYVIFGYTPFDAPTWDGLLFAADACRDDDRGAA